MPAAVAAAPSRWPQDAREQFAAPSGAELAVVVAYGKILPPPVLGAIARGCINVHGSLLPRYRGAAPIQWAVIHGEPETGVVMRLITQADFKNTDVVHVEDQRIDYAPVAVGACVAGLTGVVMFALETAARAPAFRSARVVTETA